MTGTEYEIIFERASSNTLYSEVIQQVCYDAFLELGVPEFTDSEREYAAKYKATLSEATIKGDVTKQIAYDEPSVDALLMERVVSDFIVPHHPRHGIVAGSTDVGDVSWVVPTIQIMTGCYCIGSAGHSWQWVAQGKSSLALKVTMWSSDVISDSAISLF